MKNLYQVFYTPEGGRRVSVHVVAESVMDAAKAVTEGKVNDVKEIGECIVVGE